MGDQAQPQYQQTAIKSAMTPNTQVAGDSVKVRQFRLTDIPDIMHRKGWAQAERFMRKWFAAEADPEHQKNFLKYKTGELDVRNLQKSHPNYILDDLPFNWLMSASTRVKPIVKNLKEEFAHINQLNPRVGLVNGFLDHLSPGLVQLMSRLEDLGWLDRKKKTFPEDKFNYFGNLPAIQLDNTTQFNYVTVGDSYYDQDQLDDVNGALGVFSIKIAATSIRVYRSLNGYPAIEIDEVGLYVRDTYDFLNTPGTSTWDKFKDWVIGGDQPLGYWGWGPEGVVVGKAAALARKDSVEHDGYTYYRVTNNSFNKYRDTTNKGADFFIYSTVELVPSDILISLSSIDFEEYLDKSKDRSKK